MEKWSCSYTYILISVVNEGACSASRPGLFTLGERGHIFGRRLGVLQIRSDLCGRKYLLPEIEPQFLGRLTRRLVIICVETDENHLKFQSG
jgi:hypothetical protein